MTLIASKEQQREKHSVGGLDKSTIVNKVANCVQNSCFCGASKSKPSQPLFWSAAFARLSACVCGCTSVYVKLTYMLFVLQRILLSPVLCSHSWLAIVITLCFCLAYLPSVFPASAAHCWQSVSMNSSATIAQGYICTATIAQVRGIAESCRLGLRLMMLIHFILSKSIMS